MVPQKSILAAALIFLVLLHRQEKNVFATLHLKENEGRFLHSSSLGSQGSSGPAFIGDTKVVAQKKVDSLKTMG